METIRLLEKLSDPDQISRQDLDHLKKVLVSFLASERDKGTRFDLLKKLIRNYSRKEIELFELNQLKNKFIGMAAHDLRNPLISIKGFSDLLLTEDYGSMTDTQKEFISMIQSSSGTMLNLVNDILDIAVIESGKLLLKAESGPFGQLIKEKVKMNRIIAEKKCITIHQDLQKCPDVFFDSDRMGQVMDNLLSNAIKFSGQGTKINVEMTPFKNLVKVSVCDEGPGIPAEELDQLFGEFTKLSITPTAGEKSTGLGLSITKKIVVAHNGKIWVESEPGNGTIFFFSLPVSKSG
ncbi:MAG: HAMP domain-containing histidine kinase [Desulfobacteraceae bacterium]|nr:HAMP domain-containing histidine kinase [Desulfobacteraceae bacterium]